THSEMYQLIFISMLISLFLISRHVRNSSLFPYTTLFRSKNMALSYLKFVVPEWIQDEGKREAVKQIGKVMNASPEIVASHDFICSVLLKDPNIIAKGGAQGVYCLALRREKISIALKVLSGTELL